MHGTLEMKVAPGMRDDLQGVRNRLQVTGAKVEKALKRFTAEKPAEVPGSLWKAMSYSLLAGGKRVRPFLAMESGLAFHVHEDDSLAVALSLEMIHTASLIHDDLPCMDNDTLRRGKPTNHMVFGEGTALLAGDALFLLGPGYAARRLEAGRRIPAARILQAVRLMLEAAGPLGICGGQTLDTIEEERAAASPWRIAYWKTAVLLRACVMVPACLGGASRKELGCLSSYGAHLGIAFQMIDDILDVSGDAGEIGKTPGKDALQEKNSFVRRWGLESAKVMAADQSHRAKAALADISRDTTVLERVVDYLAARSA